MISAVDDGPRPRDDEDDDERQVTCYCFGLTAIPGWCESEVVVDTEEVVDTTNPLPFRRSSRGRALRVLVIGNSAGKHAVLEGLRAGGSAPAGGAAAARRERRRFGDRLIFNDVPARDLDRPRRSSDLEAYLARAACALIVVDAAEPYWLRDADRWVERLADSARVPVALLVDVRAAGARGPAAVEADAERMRGVSSLPFVGWFVSADGAADETAACVAAIVDFVDDDPHDPRPSRRAVEFTRGGGAADAAAPTPTRPIGRAKLSGGPRPSPGTYADNVNASISPYTP